MILLATDVLCATRRPERMPRRVAWIERQRPATLAASVVSLGEVERGIARQEPRNPPFAADLRRWVEDIERRFDGRILGRDAEAARVRGRLSDRLGHTSSDLKIAATALPRGLAVVTRNLADFAPTGVALVDPDRA